MISKSGPPIKSELTTFLRICGVGFKTNSFSDDHFRLDNYLADKSAELLRLFSAALIADAKFDRTLEPLATQAYQMNRISRSKNWTLPGGSSNGAKTAGAI
jgi:hypothetical protein